VLMRRPGRQLSIPGHLFTFVSVRIGNSERDGEIFSTLNIARRHDRRDE
jgi:hypothetical protein